MKLVCILLLVLCAAIVAAETDLPSTSELSSLLSNEPIAARFAERPTESDFVSFSDGSSSSSPESGSSSSSNGGEEGEFDAEISQVEEDIKKLKEQIKESEEYARRLTEQKAEMETLIQQKERLEKEKEKNILERKVRKQMKDLSEINKMSHGLRKKFMELKHTQDLIKHRLMGTKISLKELEGDSDVTTEEMHTETDQIGKEIERMQKAQTDILKRTHERNSQAVRSAIKENDQIVREARAKH